MEKVKVWLAGARTRAGVRLPLLQCAIIFWVCSAKLNPSRLLTLLVCSEGNPIQRRVVLSNSLVRRSITAFALPLRRRSNFPPAARRYRSQLQAKIRPVAQGVERPVGFFLQLALGLRG